MVVSEISAPLRGSQEEKGTGGMLLRHTSQLRSPVCVPAVPSEILS